jgi:hypothetical protein
MAAEAAQLEGCRIDILDEKAFLELTDRIALSRQLERA